MVHWYAILSDNHPQKALMTFPTSRIEEWLRKTYIHLADAGAPPEGDTLAKILLRL